jgi:hypothetical protein
MKKILALALLGTAATTAFGQGHVVISNYLVPPYNQVTYGPGFGAQTGKAVMSTAVQLTFWYGAGVVPAGSLVAGNSFTVDPGLTFDPGAGKGPGGYYSAIFLSPAIGEYTVQVRASGNLPEGPLTGSSSVFQVTTASTGLPAATASVSPGLVVTIVPEPSTFALAGLGAAALLIFRRRA